MNAAPKPKIVSIFIGTFVSAFLFAVGIGTLAFQFTPALAILAQTSTNTYLPQLPLSADRAEAFFDVDTTPARTLYPPLAAADIVTAQKAGQWIHLPAINVTVPLAQSPSLTDDDIINTLNRGAALYPNGIEAGHLGNTFIAAHSTGNPWHGKYRFAFLKINEIEPGHLVHLDSHGTRYTYRVTEKEIIKPTPDLRIASDRPVPTVTLMACWPLWSTDKRIILTAELTNVTKLTATPS